MKRLQLSDILDLTQYERRRKEIRAEVMAMKVNRRLPVNEILTLLFENRRTVWYQVQEMARAERMVEDAAIQGEIDAYGPLVPGPDQWKTTLYIEIPDEPRLKATLPKLPGIEHSFYARIGDERIRAVGEEGRSREDYTSTVHYLTWTLTPSFLRRFLAGEALHIGTTHPFCSAEVEVQDGLRRELASDLQADAE